MAAKASKSEKGLAARVGRLEREVKEMTRETPMPPEEVASAQAGPDRAAEVAQTIQRLEGSSRNDLMSDQERGPVSGLGHGTGSTRRRR